MSGLLDLLFALLDCIVSIWSADRSLGENSRLGDTRYGKEARRFWLIWSFGCLGLVVIAVAGVVAWKVWR